MRPPRATGPVLVVIALLGAVAACGQTAANRPVYPELTYGHLPPIRLDVASVEIVDDYESPLRPPNVEHEFPVTPAAAARRWAKERLKAVGQSGVARAIVRDASVVEVDLKQKGGLTGLFTTEQSQRYDARLVMEIEIRSERGFKDAFVSAEAKRSRTVPENLTLNEREKVYFKITEAVMGDLNAQLEKQINQHLARYLR